VIHAKHDEGIGETLILCHLIAYRPRCLSSQHPRCHAKMLTDKSSHSNVGVLSSVTYLNRTPTFERYVIRCSSKSISTLGQKGKLSKCVLKGSKHALNFFRVALPHRYLHTGSSTRKIVRNIPCNVAKVARFTESQVDEAPECGRNKSNAHPRG
jgi:hypothetical protein